MKFTDEEGKVWEGVPSAPFKGETRWVLMYPVPTIHEFGGVKFEETGEERKAQYKEWWLYADGCTAYFQWGRTETKGAHPILRPLQGE